MTGTELPVKSGFNVVITFKVDGQEQRWMKPYPEKPLMPQVAIDSGLQVLLQLPPDLQNAMYCAAIRCQASNKLFEELSITVDRVEMVDNELLFKDKVTKAN